MPARISRLQRVLRRAAVQFRILKFRLLSTTQVLGGARRSPVLALGAGSITATGVTLGYWPSPYLFDGVIHLEARSRDSRIVIGPSTVVNNGAVFISAGPGIQIGQDVLIGPGVHIYDSDFHPLDYALRGVQLPRRGAVDIGDGCFIGARATICKGVRIGSNAVVGAGSVVSSDVPADGIVGGAPARLLRFVDGQAVHEPAIEGEAL